MKICMLTDAWISAWGGGQKHIQRISEIMRQKYGCLVDVVTPERLNPKFDFNNFWHRIAFALWVPKFLLTANYDIFHSHSFSTDIFLPLAKLRGKKIGLTVHGRGVEVIGGGILNKVGVFKFIMWLILYVWPYDFRLSAGKLRGYVVIGNGVDLAEFDQEKARPSSKYFTVLCVSRADPVKGVEFLEKAIRIVQRKYAKVRLNLVSGRMRTAKDFKAADLYVLPSLSEGLPLVLLEAMAAKLPIVATDVGDCRELVQNANAGIIIPPANVTRLSKGIIKMIKDKKRQILGHNGYSYVKDNCTWGKVTQKVLQIYEGIAA